MNALWERRYVLKNGVAVYFRPITAQDDAYLIDIFDHLSPDSRYNRFQQAMEGVTERRAKQIAAQMVKDSVEHGFGLLAFVESADNAPIPVGGIRYFRESPTSEKAEFSVTVRDDMQGLGLGKLLLAALIEQARSAGIHYLTGSALAENTGLWRLLDSTGLTLVHLYDGADTYFEMSL